MKKKLKLRDGKHAAMKGMKGSEQSNDGDEGGKGALKKEVRIEKSIEGGAGG